MFPARSPDTAGGQRCRPPLAPPWQGGARGGCGAGTSAIAAGALWLSGCSGSGLQSTLNPAGRGAERLAELFWWMAGGAAVIWVAVIGLAIYAVRAQPASHTRSAALLIIGGGAIVPTVVLCGLLVYGLAMLPELLAPAPAGSLKISVTGEQWWWRVRYERAEGEAVELANEIRLPVGKPIEFQLQAADVIHSFWIPSLGGKVDMIPGRETRLSLHPTRTGVFRGVCAEYCGTSHALMSFYVVVDEQEDFDRWLERQTESAQSPVGPLAEKGRLAFLAHGCGACHTVRGTSASGVVGPDLTHVGSRLSLAGGILPNEPEAFERWIAGT
ncbi:MAG: cytochrome c oxidase subunit II, partial [Planctomycetes bacterium]|nr:cytochrome c oxidase subunit II [Planctomycetota bacterium]